ncbi:hypothetical protein GCM10010911_44830 [Paenibacillus nasutitermitis]|uniref:Uncharacterized protein n=1 Tax=Paenibacillus nasutitermitis TaxID=1652958 RepID=A0A917DXT7_9BACL|nr:hypothetical protein GCM10010911_44830 [Paenibacillus nasutitermitis]
MVLHKEVNIQDPKDEATRGDVMKERKLVILRIEGAERFMLESVGYPVAVSPTPDFRAEAKRQGWQIL